MKRTTINTAAIFGVSLITIGYTNAQNSNPWPTSGAVGIGTSSPASPNILHVVGKTRFDVAGTAGGNGRFYFTRPALSNYENLISFGTNGTSAYEWVLGTTLSSADFGVFNWTAGRCFSIVNASGNVSIGNIPSPLKKLHIGGDAIISAGTNPTSAGLLRSNTTYSAGSNPEFTWYMDENTGMFHPALENLGLSTNGAERMRIDILGNVGINKIPLAAYKLDVNGAINATSYYNNGTLLGMWTSINSDIYYNVTNGSVGMGIIDPAKFVCPASIDPSLKYKLVVNGAIRAKAINVEAGWADFVFNDDYKLMPLDELEQFILTNNHLPEIPTANEVSADGIEVGSISSLLLQKIEELTLYMIELKKENSSLKNKIEALIK